MNYFHFGNSSYACAVHPLYKYVHRHTGHFLPAFEIAKAVAEILRKVRQTKQLDGWHPQCFSFIIPVMVAPEEMAKMNEAFVKGEDYTPKGEPVTEYPEEFKDWCRNNAPKIKASQQRGTEPYFVRNNAEVVEEIINPKTKPLTIAEKDILPVTNSATDDDEKRRIEEARKKFVAYQYNETDETRHRAFDENTGGYYVTLKGHQFSQVKPPTDINPNPYLSGGQAELRLVDSLHKMGKQIELLPENGKGQGKPDMSFDGKTWDSKYIPLANVGTIRTYIKDARKADCVIFHWEDKSRINDLRIAMIAETKRFKSLGREHELPDIYWADINGKLHMIWKKTKRG